MATPDPRPIIDRLTAAGCTIDRQDHAPRITITAPDGAHVGHHASDALAWLRTHDQTPATDG